MSVHAPAFLLGAAFGLCVMVPPTACWLWAHARCGLGLLWDMATSHWRHHPAYPCGCPRTGMWCRPHPLCATEQRAWAAIARSLASGQPGDAR